MTNNNPSPGNDSGLPAISDLHFNALIVADLFEAVANLSDPNWSGSGPQSALITLARPYARELAENLEKLVMAQARAK